MSDSGGYPRGEQPSGPYGPPPGAYGPPAGPPQYEGYGGPPPGAYGPPAGPPQYEGYGGPPPGAYGPPAGPPPGAQYGPPQYGMAPQGPPGYGIPGDEMPGQLTAARVILFIQGGLGAIATLLMLIMTIMVASVSTAATTALPEELGSSLGGLGVGLTLLMVLFLVISALITGVTFFLAARFTRRRHGIRIGILVLEGVFGALNTISAISGLASGEGSGALSLLFAALCWTVFAILLTEPAKRYFSAV